MEVETSQTEEIQVIPGVDWWWASWAILSVVALVLNILFIIVAVKQRKSRDLRSLLTAALITLAVLDVLDILRVASSIVVNVHTFQEYKITFCSLGVFHTVGVSLILSLSTLYLVFPCRDSPPLYYPATPCSGSLPQKILLPLIIAISGGAAAVIYLVPELTEEITDENGMVPHSCMDYTRVLSVTNENNEKFIPDLYQTLVFIVGVVLPLLLAPPTILVAAVRSCMKGQCCHVKYKQNAGELLCVLFIVFFYLGTVVAVVLPRLDSKIGLDEIQLESAPTLWELANAVARPVICFLCNPGVWDGVVSLCTCSRHESVNLHEEEEGVALQPVVERVSSL